MVYIIAFCLFLILTILTIFGIYEYYERKYIVNHGYIAYENDTEMVWFAARHGCVVGINRNGNA